jgi:hypothetical protein
MATPQWKTPPSVSPAVLTASKNFVSVVKSNLQAIKKAIILNSFPRGLNPYLSAETVVNIVEKIVVGPTHAAEGGWGDHPNDNGGPTMRGVILITFRGLFDNIFIDTGIVAKEAREFKKLGWFTGVKGSPGWEMAKQVLYQVCGDAEVASLFVYQFAASTSNRSPAAVMSTDPWLGFLMHQAAWASGAGYWKQYNYGSIFTKYGWTGGSIATFVKGRVSYNNNNLQINPPGNLVGELLGQHANWITANTKPGMRLEPFRKGWLNRLVYTPSISWTHAIVSVNSEIAKNSLTTNPTEQGYLKALAAYYNQLVIDFPNL